MPFVFAALTMMTLGFVSNSITSQLYLWENSFSEEDHSVSGHHRLQQYVLKVSALGINAAMWNLLLPASFAIVITIFIGYAFGSVVLAGFNAGLLNAYVYIYD